MRERCDFGLRSTLVMLALGLSGIMSGCQTWHREPIGPSLEGAHRRDVLQLWIGGHAHEVHGVVVRGDSVAAVPRFQALDCEGCTLHFAVSSIDSVRVHVENREGTHRVGQGVLVVGLFALAGFIVLGLALF